MKRWKEPEGLMMKALGNPGRMRVYDTILWSPGSTVTEICDITGFKQPAVSHYLNALERADLIQRITRNTFSYCYPTTRGIRQLHRYVSKATRYAARGKA